LGGPTKSMVREIETSERNREQGDIDPRVDVSSTGLEMFWECAVLASRLVEEAPRSRWGTRSPARTACNIERAVRRDRGGIWEQLGNFCRDDEAATATGGGGKGSEELHPP